MGRAVGGEVDGLSLQSFEDDSHSAVVSEEELLKTASEEEEAEQPHEDHSQEEDEQPHTPSEDPSLEEAEEPHTGSEGPSPEGQSNAHEGPGTSGEGMYTLGEESSQEESLSSDVDSNDEEAPKKKATRKRRKRPDVWQKNKRKRRRNSGKKYVSTSKKVVPPKRPTLTTCGCKLKCFTIVSDNQRKALFDGFWGSGNFDVQNAYLCGCIRVQCIKRRYSAKKGESRRNFTREYYVPNGELSTQVCKKAFCSIFAVSDGRITRALKAQAAIGGSPHSDKRGCHEPKNKTSEAKTKAVKEHIESFPKYRSHYSRQDNPNRSYLSPVLSLTKMYSLYKEKCTEDDQVSEWVYRKIFNTEYNLSFGRPKSDTCKTCDSLNVQIAAEEDSSAKEQLQFDLQLHQCKAERAYQQLKEDSALSRSSSTVDTITFDLQQSLPTPKLSTGIIFYKRQLWTYNFGIHDCCKEKGYMFMWPESVASRGSAEIGSSILQYLKLRASDATHLIVFSDACGGQNRNINIACLWMHVVSSSEFNYSVVDHKFMISGHSYLPNDRDFGLIENANRRTQLVFVPEEWCTLVERARSKNPFQVVRMKRENFVSTKKIRAEIVYRKVNTKKEKVEWLNIRWIKIQKEKPFEIRYRYSHNALEAWKILDVQRKRAGRPTDPGRKPLVPLYTNPCPINVKKLQDLQELLDFIPPVHHAFYNNLQSIADTHSGSEEEASED